MARPRLELGTWGKVARSEVAPGKWRARARFRDFTGRTKQVEAYGDSGAKAERALLKTLRKRVQTAGDTITGDTTVAALATIYLAQLEDSDQWTEQTIQRYAATVDSHVVPALGELALIEATVSRVDRFLRALADKTPGTANSCRTVLNGMFSLAVRHDALRTNPVKEVRLPTRKRRPVQALTVDEVTDLRTALAAWQDEDGVRGPGRGTDLLDVVDVMLG
ncbi:MAG: phage integrase central domain-containing protein, partial [Brevibacterium yomogidense]